MSEGSRRAPNTHLGEVEWYYDPVFGNLLWLAQDLLGMRGTPRKGFLDPTKHTIGGLWDFLQDFRMPNGMLGFTVCADDWGGPPLADIKTTLPYDEPMSDQAFLNLIADFVEHVRAQPLVSIGEGALSEEELAQALGRGDALLKDIVAAVHEEVDKSNLTPEVSPSEDDEDDIPF